MDRTQLRQIVLVTDDLDQTLQQLRVELGVDEGVRDPSMADLGLDHEVVPIGPMTFLEIVTPTGSGDPASKRLERNGGPGGYMVVLQTPSMEDVTRPALESAGITPIMDFEFHGALCVQIHPRDAGTLLEIDEISPPESWHFSPEILHNVREDVTSEIVAVEIAVVEPALMAARWATTFGGFREAVTAVDFAGRKVRFVPSDGAQDGLVAFDVKVTDRSRAGQTLTIAGTRVNAV